MQILDLRRSMRSFRSYSSMEDPGRSWKYHFGACGMTYTTTLYPSNVDFSRELIVAILPPSVGLKLIEKRRRPQ